MWCVYDVYLSAYLYFLYLYANYAEIIYFSAAIYPLQLNVNYGAA